ncbi:hypothetical protein [Flavobacterium sp. AJR]|jgi:hypothetical protein|nr:hypothetical protein [Flavobacterium sp. AJR]
MNTVLTAKSYSDTPKLKYTSTHYLMQEFIINKPYILKLTQLQISI